MLSLTEIVLRIRAECPAFSRRVGGTAEYGAAFQDDTADLDVPHCFVVPMEEGDISANLLIDTDSRQDIRESFSTIIAVDNSVNRAGAKGLMRLEPYDVIIAIREELNAALIGWRPLEKYDPVRFSRGQSLGLDNKRLWHTFEWFVRQEETVAPTDVENEVNEIINGITDVPTLEDSFLARLERIYVNYQVTNHPLAHLSRDDFFTLAVGNPGTIPATPEELQAAREGAEEVIDIVRPDEPPTLSDDTLASESVSTTQDAPSVPQQHGIHVTEPKRGRRQR